MQQNRAKRNPTSSHIPQSLTQILRPVTGFRDLEYFSGEDAFLYDQEVEALLEVALMALNCLPYVPAKGILILDGQKRGEDAQCILRAPLRCGAQGSSKTYAEKAIDYILEQNQPMNNGIIRTPVSNSSIVDALVLNTTAGRFISSLYCEDIPPVMDFDYEEMVLLAIAAAIGCMGREDITLQKSIQQIKTYYQDAGYKKMLELMREIEKLFEYSDNPALRAWQKWHEPANQNGELKLFFE